MRKKQSVRREYAKRYKRSNKKKGVLYNEISDRIIMCFFYDETGSAFKCFFMSQFGVLTIDRNPI